MLEAEAELVEVADGGGGKKGRFWPGGGGWEVDGVKSRVLAGSWDRD